MRKMRLSIFVGMAAALCLCASAAADNFKPTGTGLQAIAAQAVPAATSAPSALASSPTALASAPVTVAKAQPAHMHVQANLTAQATRIGQCKHYCTAFASYLRSKQALKQTGIYADRGAKVRKSVTV